MYTTRLLSASPYLVVTSITTPYNSAFATASVSELLPLSSGKLFMAATVNRVEFAMDISKLDCDSL